MTRGQLSESPSHHLPRQPRPPRLRPRKTFHWLTLARLFWSLRVPSKKTIHANIMAPITNKEGRHYKIVPWWLFSSLPNRLRWSSLTEVSGSCGFFIHIFSIDKSTVLHLEAVSRELQCWDVSRGARSRYSDCEQNKSIAGPLVSVHTWLHLDTILVWSPGLCHCIIACMMLIQLCSIPYIPCSDSWIAEDNLFWLP